MIPSAADIYNEAFNRGLRPDPELTVSEWADQHRRLSGKGAAEPGQWRTSRTADTEIAMGGALLRDRMRDLVRNNPHAAKAVWDRWTRQCDADGQLHFYGLQTLICREMVEAGEVMVWKPIFSIAIKTA